MADDDAVNRFDPQTGKPLQPRFDPQTGKPLGGQVPGTLETTAAAPASPETNKKKKKHRFRNFVFLIVAIVVIVVISTNASGGGSDPVAQVGASAGAKANSAANKGAQAVAIGVVGKDGQVEFKATDFSCGLKQIGTNDFGVKAQGQFCILTLSAKNVGNDQATISDSSIKLYDKAGAEYGADSGAAIYLDDNDVLFTEINPGNTATGRVVFDVPTAFAADHVNLRSGFGITTQGVNVTVG